MPITISCACGRRFRVDSRYAGKHAHCPYCGQRLDILADQELMPLAQVIGEQMPLRDEELAVIGLSPGDEGWRYQALFDLAPDGYLVSDPQGLVEEANRAAEELFGVQRAYLAGKPLGAFIAEVDRPAFQRVIDRLQRGEALRGWEGHIVPHSARQMVPCIFSIMPSRNAQGGVVGLRWMLRDITERKRAEARIKAYQDHLRSLASELLETEERERRELAVDLHDGLGQTLALVKMKLDMLRQQAEGEAQRRAIGEVETIISEAHQSVRSLTFQISPPILHDLGFIPAVQWLIDDLCDRYGLEVEFHYDDHGAMFTGQMRVILFRAVRELLINVAKHANVKQARLALMCDGRVVRVVVEDPGEGFDVARVLAPDGGHGFGLFSIRERLDYQLGGRMEIVSQPGEGTCIVLEAPLPTSDTPVTGED